MQNSHINQNIDRLLSFTKNAGEWMNVDHLAVMAALRIRQIDLIEVGATSDRNQPVSLSHAISSDAMSPKRQQKALRDLVQRNFLNLSKDKKHDDHYSFMLGGKMCIESALDSFCSECNREMIKNKIQSERVKSLLMEFNVNIDRDYTYSIMADKDASRLFLAAAVEKYSTPSFFDCDKECTKNESYLKAFSNSLPDDQSAAQKHQQHIALFLKKMILEEPGSIERQEINDAQDAAIEKELLGYIFYQLTFGSKVFKNPLSIKGLVLLLSATITNNDFNKNESSRKTMVNIALDTNHSLRQLWSPIRELKAKGLIVVRNTMRPLFDWIMNPFQLLSIHDVVTVTDSGNKLSTVLASRIIKNSSFAEDNAIKNENNALNSLAQIIFGDKNPHAAWIANHQGDHLQVRRSAMLFSALLESLPILSPLSFSKSDGQHSAAWLSYLEGRFGDSSTPNSELFQSRIASSCSWLLK